MKAITPEEALAIYHAGPEAVVKTICELSQTVCKLSARVMELEERLKTLEDQISKNSRNSSKPPSSDGFHKPKPKSLRERSGKLPGGQEGHEGHHLEIVEYPDHVIQYAVMECERCGHRLDHVPAHEYERRQVFDLPPMKMEVTERQVEIKQCPRCGYQNKSSFPHEVVGLVQYGSRMKSVIVYLSTYQFIPYGRLQELFSDLFSCPLSQGTLVSANRECAEHLIPAERNIKDHILQSPVAHFDETGLQIKGRLSWLHGAGTQDATAYLARPKRGQEAMEEMGILPYFQGTAVHDHLESYFAYACDHALCNAHHLRELIFVLEQHQQAWAREMIDCLLDMKALVDQRKATRRLLSSEEIAPLEQRYDEILAKGFLENPSPPFPESAGKKRGRKKQSKPKNLLDRFQEERQETLTFLHDLNVPFDNNLAEKDIRMMKARQKISGTFRSEAGAEVFCRIRGYLSTARKNAVNILEAIQGAFDGHPFIPSLEAVLINGP